MTRVSTVVAAAFFLFAAASAEAQPGDPPAAVAGERAEQLMKEGLALGDQKKWAEARKKLEEAWSLRKSYDIAANLALVETELGDYPAAATHLDYAIRTLPVNAKPEHKSRLLEQFQKVRVHVGSIQAQADVEGATILVDGVAVDRPVPDGQIFTKPGTRTIEARKAGYKPAARQVTVEAGTSLAFNLSLEKDDGTVVGPGDGGTKPIWPYITLGGVTALGIGLGIGLHVASASKAEEAEGSVCPGDGDTCPAEASDALSGANGMLGGAIAGYTLAGLGVVGLIAYGAWSGPVEPEAAVRVLPMLGPQGGGVHLTVTF